MRIISKEGDEIYILFDPERSLRIGDVLKVEDMLTQIVDIEYASLPGIMEHVLRKSIVKKRTEEEMEERVKGYLDTLSDHKMAKAKIRGTVKDGSFSQGIEELKANRSSAEISRVGADYLLNDVLHLDSNHAEKVGEVSFEESEDFDLQLDGLGINLITGMKGSGKSYLAKKVLLRLIDHGKVTIVFDVNGEYLNLWKNEDGRPNSKYYERIEVLDPKIGNPENKSVPLKIPLHEVDYEEFASMFNVGTDTQMYNELIRFWSNNEMFDLDDFENWLREDPEINDFSQQGLLSKVRAARGIGLFGPFDFEKRIKDLQDTGGALIVNLKGEKKQRRQMIVEHILNRITSLRKNKEINPVSLFAEEAQLYVKESLWDDLLTRMRHYGIFPTFITNDPRTLPDEAYSLCDNLISFAFHNTDDLKALSKAKMIDIETLQLLRSIEFQKALTIGNITSEFPIIVDIHPEKGVMMGGETEELF